MSASSVEHLRSYTRLAHSRAESLAPVDFDSAQMPLMKIVEPVSTIEGQTNFIDKDFDVLVDQLHGTGQHLRRLEERVNHFQQTHSTVERLHEELRTAMSRASNAEARALEADGRASAQIKIFEERLIAAEERARKAEQWLAYIQQTVRNEFRDIPL